MKKKRRFRGVSFGTVLMLALSVIVLVGMGKVLPRLCGDNAVDLNADRVMQALNLSGFELRIQDTPLPQTLPPAATPVQVQTPSPTAVPAATATPYAGSTARLTFGGTVAIEDGVRKSCYYSDSKKYDLDEMMTILKGTLSRSDMTVLPLENLIVEGQKVSELIAPIQAMTMLKNAGVDVVTLGFSRMLDKGVDALASTISAARLNGLEVLGAFVSEMDNSITDRIHEINGIKVALLHYTDTLSSSSQSALKKSGASWMVPQKLIAAADIALARELGAEVIIVSLHWGKQGTGTVDSAQKKLAQQLADAGADVIVGAGSRMVQPAVWLSRADGGRTLCCYSLGNLISDSRTDNGVAGMLLHLTFSKTASGVVTLTETAYTPTYVWRYKQDDMYHYRLVPSSMEPPDGMEESQQTSMNRARGTVQTRLGADTPLEMH